MYATADWQSMVLMVVGSGSSSVSDGGGVGGAFSVCVVRGHWSGTYCNSEGKRKR
jgi:hypothetical protein